MRIFSAHNQYQIRGGEEESCDSEEQLLRDNSHEVYSYREHNDRIAALRKVTVATKTIWSTETYKQVSEKLSTQPYDIVHIQNFFPLISPAVHYAAKSKGIPVIQTLRNYRLLCPNALFFRDGKVCEDCLGKTVPYPGIIHSCYRESRGASTAVAAMITVHRSLRTWENRVDRFITLSHFAREKFIQGGLPANKISVKPNFVFPDPCCGSGAGKYAIYVGRLSVEKGLDTLLEAWELLKDPCPLKIVGDGPLADYVRQTCEQNTNIEWLGRRAMDEVHELMGNAAFLVFPSKWYETFGRVAVEAFAKGTPVIGADIGAIAELINHKQTGLLFKPSDANDLAKQVDWFLAHPQKLAQMRKIARNEFESKYTATINYQKIMEIYADVL